MQQSGAMNHIIKKQHVMLLKQYSTKKVKIEIYFIPCL